MLVSLIVLAVLMSGSVGPQAQTQTQARRNTDVPSGPAVWPLINSPAPTQGAQLLRATIRALKTVEIAKVLPPALTILAQ